MTKIIGNSLSNKWIWIRWAYKKYAPSQTQQPSDYYATHNSSSAGNWLVDSGATYHVTQDLHNLSLHSNYDDTKDIIINDGKKHKITQTRSASLPYSRPLTLSNVSCVPKMKKKPYLCSSTL